MAIHEVSLSFPDFKLGEIIDPDEFDQNNADLVDKINEVVKQLNVVSSDGYVGTNQLADDAVVTAKLGDGAVVTAKITDGAVTELKIADNSISTQKLKDESVTGSKIRRRTITGDNIAPTSITIDKINLLDFDARYYTKELSNSLLLSKTDKNGNHEGTWQGLSPSDFDPDGAVLELGEIRDHLYNHTSSFNNPHGTTWEDINLFTFDALSSIAQSSSLRHVADLDSVDENGTYRVVDFYIGSLLYKKHTLSAQNSDGYYTSLNIKYYNSNGDVINSIDHALSVDENGTVTEVK